MAHQSSLSGEPNGSVDHPSHVDADRPGQVVARSPFTPVQSLNGALDPHLAQSTAHYYLTAEHPAAAHARSIPADHISYYTTAQPTHELPIPPPPQPTVSSPKRLHPDSHPQPYPPVPTSNQGGNNVASTSAGVHGNNNSSTGPRKKRRTGGGAPEYEEEEEDVDGDGQTGGARHWTDDEKTTLFSWLMAAGQDDHFDALRTKKNTCFRECAQDAFGGRKSFLAVKGCYERNFAVFKNIFAFEEFTANMAQQQPTPVVDDDSEVDRLREYERRIFTARKAGFNIGSMSSRLLDHWHRTGWYGIFHARWHNDPTLRRPPQAGGVRAKSMAPPSYAHESHSQHVHAHDSTPDAMPVLSGPPPPHEQDYAPPSEVSSPATTPAIHAHAHYPAPSYPPPPPSLPPLQTHLHAQSQAQAQAPQQHQSHQQHQQQHQQQQHQQQQQHHQQPIHVAPIEAQSQNQSQSQNQNQNQNMAAFAGALHECVRLLQAQVEDSRVRLEYARRREEREAAEFETAQRGARVKEKSERALEILSNPHVPEEYKQSAGEYLKKFFAAD